MGRGFFRESTGICDSGRVVPSMSYYLTAKRSRNSIKPFGSPGTYVQNGDAVDTVSCAIPDIHYLAHWLHDTEADCQVTLFNTEN
jgi:hypothetical protein